MRLSIRLFSIVALALGFLFFWLIPASQRNQWITGVGLVSVAAFSLALSVTLYRELGTWRGFGIVLSIHVVSQIWLLWQWDLWNSPTLLVRNLNVVAELAALVTLIALFVSLVLLLIFRDASVIALAVAWLGWPILLIATALRFRTMANLDNMPERERLIWAVPICLLSFLVFSGGLTFLAHLLWLGIKEIVGREIVGQA